MSLHDRMDEEPERGEPSDGCDECDANRLAYEAAERERQALLNRARNYLGPPPEVIDVRPESNFGDGEDIAW
jgi:hypothetical protein